MFKKRKGRPRIANCKQEEQGMQWPRTKYPGLGPALKQVSGILFPLKGIGSVLKTLLEQESVVFSVTQ